MFDPLRHLPHERGSRVPVEAHEDPDLDRDAVDSLGGRTIDEAIRQKALPPQEDGIYILLAKHEKKIEVRVANPFEEVVGDAERKGFATPSSRAFGREARGGGDPRRESPPPRSCAAGTKNGAHGSGTGSRRTRGESSAKSSGAPLVVRDQVKHAPGPRRILEGAETKAREMGLKVNIAVVDDGGHLLAFARMDGARPASGYTAITKATTAATFRQETGPLPRGANTPDLLLNLSLQNAAAASGGKLTTLYGGVPVQVDNQVIGAVGVGGGTSEQDAIICKAGIELFLQELKSSQNPPSSHAKPSQP